MTKIESNGNNTVDQSSSTDEAAFGSCEPGTNVVLQGIVWNETDKGIFDQMFVHCYSYDFVRRTGC